ncbi:GtrA family protein [Ruegeria sp. HKCCD7559]|uniref:GtrA family protein n=1 Tax=Ruegeria sp. HKCCD7559 TaxID=2683005 RepID=UPI001491116B|nr:GtrA family protein [Ruegeria sp. HKCCD7559]
MRPFDLKSILSFGVVGILATVTHALLAVTLIEISDLHPFSANAFGFGTGFIVSYFGHHRFSFQSEAGHRRAMPRFLAVAGFGLLLNQVIVYLIVNLWGLNYFIALNVIILTVPATTYLASRRWAFAKLSS